MKKTKILLALILIMGIIVGCSNNSNDKTKMTAGTYTVTKSGYGGDIEVEVKVSTTKIESITVIKSSETAAIGDSAMESLTNVIIDKQTIEVDAITGATITSNAFISAIEDALIQAGANIDDFKTTIARENEGKIIEIDTDVVVIGAGGAGVSASVTAADEGANVILLEKTAIPGGTTANGGGFFAADSNKAQEIGHEALDIAYIFEKYMNEMDWKADANMVQKFLETSKTTADWLEEKGVVFYKAADAVQQTHAEGTNGYHKYIDFTATSDTFAKIIDNTENLTVYYETPATKLIINDKNEVIGVEAQQKDGSTLKVNAKSVVIATGGFVGNLEMVKEALNGTTVNASGFNSNVGDGILMASDIGAATRSMSAMVTHTLKVEASSNVTGEYESRDLMNATGPIAYLPMSVWLNAQGVRIANEDLIYDRALSSNAIMTHGDFAWFLYTEDMLKAIEQGGASAARMQEAVAMGPFAEYTPMEIGWNNLLTIIEDMSDDELLVKANSLDELANKTGMDKETLIKTMNLYNTDAKNGVDSKYGKRKEHMVEMSEGPYYAIKVTINNLSTVGGLRINNDFNVVFNDSENGFTPIKNLFAAGSDASAIYADHYAHTIEGAAQGWAYTSGRLAGASAASNALGIVIEIE